MSDRLEYAALVVGLLAVSLAALSGCDSDFTSPLLDMPADGSAPEWGTAPFPNDVWRGDDGYLEPPVGLDQIFHRNADAIARHLAVLDGFGVRPLVEFPVDGHIDPDSLDGHVYVMGPDGSKLDYEWRVDSNRNVIAGVPALGVVLRSGTTYTAVLETGISDQQGQPLRRANAMRALAGGDVASRWQSTADAFDNMEADKWLAVAVFTTQRAQRTLRAGRALLDTTEVQAPTLSFPQPEFVHSGRVELDRLLGVATRAVDGPRAGLERWGMSNPTGLAHDNVGVIASGLMTATRFRRDDSRTDDPDDETFLIDPDTGAPIPVAVDSLPVTFVIPAQPPPPAGYPVVIFAHGLGASRHAVLSFAEPLSAAGFVIVAIDASGHGSRWRSRDAVNNLAAIIPSFNGDATRPDGFGDRTGVISTFEFLENFNNLSGARDAIQQSVLDFSQLVALVRQPNLDLSALSFDGRVPKLDSRRIAFLGESFGTILGGILAAIEPDLELFVLDVPAAGLVDLSIINSPALATLLVPVTQALYGIDGPIDRYHPAISLIQAMFDPADPLTYAPNVLRNRQPVGERMPGPRHVVAIEVVGDEVMHNIASESLARAMGLEILVPYLFAPDGIAPVEAPAAGNIDGQTGVFVQYAPATHGANWTSEVGTLSYVPGFPHPGIEPFPMLDEPIEIANPIYATLEQVVHILVTHQRGDDPEVLSTLAPVAD